MTPEADLGAVGELASGVSAYLSLPVPDQVMGLGRVSSGVWVLAGVAPCNSPPCAVGVQPPEERA